MNWSKFFLFLAFSFISFVSNGQHVTGQSWSAVKKQAKGELACIYYPTPGLIFNEGGELKGVCVDIMNEFKAYVKEKHQVEIVFNFVREEPVFTNFINSIREGKNVMGVCNTSITDDRKKYLDFSPAYMNNPSVLLSNLDAPIIKSLDQMPEAFKNYKAVIIKGSTHEKFIKTIAAKYYPGLNIEFVDSGADVNEKLRSNQPYFTVIDFTEYFDAVRKKLSVKRHTVSLNELEDQLGFIFPKGSDWVAIWNEFLTPEFKQSIKYKKIVADNLGTSFVSLIK